MKSRVFAAALAVALATTSIDAAITWNVEQGAVRVICPMTIGGSFDAKTTALKGVLTAGAGGTGAFDGSLAVDLRTLDTGIDLRNSHLRENYLEVNKGPAFESATLSEIDVKGFTEESTHARTTFAGLLTPHGVSRRIAGWICPACTKRQRGVWHRCGDSRPPSAATFPLLNARREYGCPVRV